MGKDGLWKVEEKEVETGKKGMKPEKKNSRKTGRKQMGIWWKVVKTYGKG